MNNLQQWGMELALLIRRRDAARAEWDDATTKIEQLCERISSEPTGTLYGSHTGEQLQVERNAVGWTVTSSASAPVETPKPRNQAPVPMSRPLRTDHQDGGSTFALTPIADTVTMPAVHQCPRATGGQCPEQMAHIHTADGIQRVADIGS